MRSIVSRSFAIPAIVLAAVLAAGGWSTAWAQGSWSTLAPVPSVGTGVEGPSVGVIGSEIIVACGFDSGVGDTATTRIYDIPSDT